MDTEILDRSMGKAIELATDGATNTVRLGQEQLAYDVAAAMSTNGHLAGEAPTGVGKSIAYGVPAALAAFRGQRTIISTESIALQSQLINKDLPVIAEALFQTVGYRPSFTVYKGWSNYACTLSAVGEATRLLAEHGQTIEQIVQDPLDGDEARTKRAVEHIEEVLDGLERLRNEHPEFAEEKLDYIELLQWALQATGGASDGDKDHFDGRLRVGAWPSISVSPDECVGVNNCAFGQVCLPDRARRDLEFYDIIVTNHSMLAVQASKDVPVVLGSVKIGPIDHLVIDEAHTLTDKVRDQGSVSFGGQNVISVMRTMRRFLDEDAPKIYDMFVDGEGIAAYVDDTLREFNKQLETPASRGDIAKLVDGQSPLDNITEVFSEWRKRAVSIVNGINPADPMARIAQSRSASRLSLLSEAFKMANRHVNGVARWMEIDERNGTETIAVKCSPVEVGAALSCNLWRYIDPDELAAAREEGLPTPPGNAVQQWAEDHPEDPEPDLKALVNLGCYDDQPFVVKPTVIAVSGTMPQSFIYDTSMSCKEIADYPSPFDDAYHQSLLYVPDGAEPLEVQRLTTSGYKNRRRFNLDAHRQWALEQMIELLTASNGSALILSATSASGQLYADRLQHVFNGKFEVFAQWDGLSKRKLVDLWRDDTSSVLIGTKSFMTGVDAPGVTNSLVILDRIPRARSHPVGDARVELLEQKAGLNKYVAIDKVYAGDAALLVEQSGGRLIRSVDDKGMFAILDPRLRATCPYSYGKNGRKIYRHATRRFRRHTSDLSAAKDFLANLHE